MQFDYSALEAGHYDLIYAKRRGIRSKWHHQKFARVRSFMGAYRNHLDIACGPGTFLGSLTGPGHSTGVDIAPAQVEYAAAKYQAPNRTFRVTEAGHLPFEDGLFDVVTVIELIEHLPHQDGLRVLAEIRRVLEPGGAMILTTPNYGALWPVLELFVNRLGTISYADQHISKYRRSSLRSLLLEAGFQIQLLETHLLFGPFAAPVGWDFADWVERAEPAAVSKRFGHLLLAKAIRV